MSETGDKRRRNDLDLFVLALIENGLTTPYELQQGAGLSPGATIPALRRLLEARLATLGKPGPRGRAEHKITAAGQRQLKSGWQELLADGPSGDLDSDLRIALLALWVGGKRRLAEDFLCLSSALLKDRLAVSEPEIPNSLPPLAFWYRKLRSASTDALAKRESAAALAMANALSQVVAPRIKPSKAKHGR